MWHIDIDINEPNDSTQYCILSSYLLHNISIRIDKLTENYKISIMTKSVIIFDMTIDEFMNKIIYLLGQEIDVLKIILENYYDVVQELNNLISDNIEYQHLLPISMPDNKYYYTRMYNIYNNIVYVIEKYNDNYDVYFIEKYPDRDILEYQGTIKIEKNNVFSISNIQRLTHHDFMRLVMAYILHGEQFLLETQHSLHLGPKSAAKII